jgi:3-hydroxy-9,10-secoandrosta-1,3,5(10)-triene-9,17-dione monooxygenase
LDRARALIPRLAERASAAAAARQLPAQTIAEYHAAGILRILQPRRFGGQQGRFSLFSRIVEELTYGCASSAWVYAVLAEHQWIIAQMSGARIPKRSPPPRSRRARLPSVSPGAGG